ncbi:F0F1 ATP synthase subunit alpha [Mangrovitalea sediminis]|uniref:F0F1 ATP synthase subunit alpha n=1 Tax=Mangrovitalea sediminis TaxID=1982043 RepID=UPI000BE617EF|nr:F0F1 ATP synthase subunit alpha [Mangrovitalea sediminis]
MDKPVPKTAKHTTPLQRQADWVADYRFNVRLLERGEVLSVGDGIAWVAGLPSAALDDILLFEDGSQGFVFDLSEFRIGAVMLHQTPRLTAGTAVHRSDHALSIPAGTNLIGRVVDPLGRPLDGKPEPEVVRRQPLQRRSPPIIAREVVNRPLYTGIKIIDALVPIGRGQRQLLIGDEGLGRTSIALDAVINQRGRDILCIYVLIGQKRSTVVNVIDTLRRFDALAYTTVIVAEASALPGLQHWAPFAGCALAEYWMQQGKDTLVVYDDLSTHAKTYRELSLLLRRPPGREAYPGDIFSVHAQLLERATNLNPHYGGGSMTALPIVETLQGEIAAYIPTNLISITDGQIYLERQLFTAGFRPAIDIARSVSRIGGKAQHPAIKREAGRMKLDYLQFLELEIFTRFGARLEASMEAAIRRGRALRQMLKQERLAPLSENVQLAWLIAFNERFFDGLEAAGLDTRMTDLTNRVATTTLTVDSAREEWLDALRRWYPAAETEAS